VESEVTLNGLLWRTVAALLLAVIVGRAEAQVYRWTDAQGQTHYGNVAVPASAQPVKDTVQVIDLRAHNQVAMRAVVIRSQSPGTYSYGGVHVIGQPDAPAPVAVVEPEGRLRSVANPFNAYAPRPKPDLSKGFTFQVRPPTPPQYFIP
jgi:hypothetical protein